MVSNSPPPDRDLLLSLSRELAAARDRGRLLEILQQSLQVFFPFDDLMITLLSGDGQAHAVYLSLVRAEIKLDTSFESMLSTAFPINDGVFDLLAATDSPVSIDLASPKRQRSAATYLDLFCKHGIREVLAISLREQDHLFGAVFICLKRRQHFNTRQLRVVSALCLQLSVAVSNIRSYEEIELRLKDAQHTKHLLEAQNLLLQQQMRHVSGQAEIVGSGDSLKRVFELISLVAATESTVLILGETGTGKELIAKAIHEASPRRDNAMIKVNCAALPATLIESELFGHEKGSFTGAMERRLGKFELAQNGTLFLDEIGEMPYDLQVKLLRVLQEREFERIGGRTIIKVNVRIIAATNKNLEEEISLHRFRSDLYYRLNVFPITLPPLRARKEDIPALANYFISRLYPKTGKHISSIAAAALKQMAAYDWPGNIRELEHLIERSMLMTSGRVLQEIAIPSAQKANRLELSDAIQSLQDHERDYILAVIKKCGGRIRGETGAARALQLPPTTLHSKMKKLGIRKTGI